MSRTAEIRLLEQDLEKKMELATYSGDNLRVCCMCEGLIAENKLPIYLNQFQKEQISDIPKTHGYCHPCIKIEYRRSFGIEYQDTF